MGRLRGPGLWLVFPSDLLNCLFWNNFVSCAQSNLYSLVFDPGSRQPRRWLFSPVVTVFRPWGPRLCTHRDKGTDSHLVPNLPPTVFSRLMAHHSSRPACIWPGFSGVSPNWASISTVLSEDGVGLEEGACVWSAATGIGADHTFPPWWTAHLNESSEMSAQRGEGMLSSQEAEGIRATWVCCSVLGGVSPFGLDEVLFVDVPSSGDRSEMCFFAPPPVF